ncbi:MerR family transcriptional regulator [Zafaria sp. Z1313]|uniref:MerR family transcriptional regulator n=1 Tax=unclassified Zafaria TaxID=2828765 RepID=UPI002E764645|nr:MerR family transcriptional regulator [Zafaria sp. J156]MEE1621416.1 MerR family transcriptional regulator [Zafaria sp. J156]
MEWSIHQVAGIAGTTSRTLRHYGDEGLLEPSRLGANGYRYYGRDELVRLQRILLLRGLGLGLPAIREVLDRPDAVEDALEEHAARLRSERDRLARMIASVEKTITAVRHGGDIMAEDMFDGFDHTAHRAEVEERWGREAYARGDAWWRGLDAGERAQWKARVSRLSADWAAAAAAGIAPDSPEAQELARRHVDWLRGVPGTPAGTADGDLKGYLAGLGQMYVADERFAANYGGLDGARFVRDALAHYAASNL